MINDPVYWALCLGCVPVFWLIPKTWRWGFLFVLSLAYLTILVHWGVVALLIWSLAFYFLSRGSFQGHTYPVGLYLILAILVYLFLFKYRPTYVVAVAAFLGISLAPADIFVSLGMSYYTFRLIHYTIEVRRGGIGGHTMMQFLCYVFLFPIFTAGPIERFDHFLSQHEKTWSLDMTVNGLTRITQGLIKKFLIIEVLLDLDAMFGRGYTAKVVSDLAKVNPPEVWVVLLITYLTLYLDFSAYCDVAIGTARLFGFNIMENFNWPILAHNIVEFWRRWHMTLAGWVQNYVYMPLIGLFRRPVVALFAAFLIIGLWHALSLNRIVWGFYHATAILACVGWSRYRRKSRRSSNGPKFNKLPGVVMTQLFLVTSMAFLVGDSNKPFFECVRILAKLFWLELPPLGL